jgi:hypothetical protein
VELSVEPALVIERSGPVAPRRAEVQPPAPVKESGAWMRPAAYAFGGVGLAGLAVGASMGAVVWSMRGDVVRGCPGGRCTTPEASERAERVQTLARASDIGFAVAGTGAVGAAVLTLLASKRSDRAGPVKPGVQAGSFEVSPGGAAAFVKGVF